ncbi:MAG: single-stranded DNA-binding protein [Selenomonadaceae bacterium]|nr:single-stranded DNA-binding protein [Selenomonadaceae bacterium]
MNKVFLSGNLTRDAEVRYSQSGKAFAKMGIAVKRPFSKDAVDFFNLTAFGKTAEFCGRYMMKGTRVLVEGSVQLSSYENKDGVKVNSVDVLVDNIEFAGSKRDGGGGDFSGTPANNDYPNRPAPPPRNNNDDWGGEPIDPEDTPF